MLSFAKYEGAGNDFILIDDRTPSFPCADEKFIRHLCNRKFGIGADGLILLQNNESFQMRIFNSDGREAESCGNGLRCLGKFILDLGCPRKNYDIVLLDRTVRISYVEDQVGVDMGEPRDFSLHLSTDKGVVHFVNTGVPHAVLFVEDVANSPLHEIGPFLRSSPLFGPKGTNVNLVEKQSDRSFQVRTFERGVEGETLACGTGACAVAAIVSKLDGTLGPFQIHFPGGDLEIRWIGSRLMMIGHATKVFEGSL